MKQLVEYEWKPLFCDKCQKIGHLCANDPPKKVQKQWQPKPAVVNAVPTPPPAAQQGTETTTMWTAVSGSGKAKGKCVNEDYPTNRVHCSNGFGPLETLNGTLVIHDTGQC
ncbi:hypothetical protein QL285_094372 [Trifolium repens]|nr:hypothetical protein QL285_094372 [Trifolium repens]